MTGAKTGLRRCGLSTAASSLAMASSINCVSGVRFRRTYSARNQRPTGRAAQRGLKRGILLRQTALGRCRARLQWISAVWGSFRHGGSEAILIRVMGPSVTPPGQGFVNVHGRPSLSESRDAVPRFAPRFLLRRALSGGRLLSALSAGLAEMARRSMPTRSPSCSRRCFTRASCSRPPSASPPTASAIAARSSSCSPGARSPPSSFFGSRTASGRCCLPIILLAINWTSIMPLIETVAASGSAAAVSITAGCGYGAPSRFIVASLGSGSVIEFFGPQVVLPLLLGATALMVFGDASDAARQAGRRHVSRLTARRRSGGSSSAMPSRSPARRSSCCSCWRQA